jgi:hypothetical protein
MTSRLDTIKNLCGGVVANTSYGIAEAWEHRRLTSKPSVDPRVYGEWDELFGIATQGRETESYDPDKGTYKKYMNSSFRYSTQHTSLQIKIGDQIKSPEGLTWNVVGTLSSGPGTVALNIGREIGLISGPDRKAGL